jgi:hypothetical protein
VPLSQIVRKTLADSVAKGKTIRQLTFLAFFGGKVLLASGRRDVSHLKDDSRRTEQPADVVRCWKGGGALGLGPLVLGLLSRAVAQPAALQMSFVDLELLRRGVRLEPDSL